MHNAKFFLKYKLHYLLIWLLLFGLWYFLRYEDYLDETTAFKVTLIKMLDLTIMVAFANYVLVPKLLYKRKYGWFAVAFLSFVIVSSLGKLAVLADVMHTQGLFDANVNWKQRIYDNVIPHFFLAVAGVAVKLVSDYGKMQLRMSEMAKEKAEAELNFLKSQINPHFLFNSLNAVYFLIDKNNADARNALHKFSDMLRYQLYEMNGERIPIEKEIRYLEDYVGLQKLRNDEHYSVQFNCCESVKGFSIEPLLLIPFVENAFKHISHFNDKMNFVKVDMKSSNGIFYFAVENSKESNQQPVYKPGGIGLTNVKRRLELLYPGRHEYAVTDGDGIYKVDLRIGV